MCVLLFLFIISSWPEIYDVPMLAFTHFFGELKIWNSVHIAFFFLFPMIRPRSLPSMNNAFLSRPSFDSYAYGISRMLPSLILQSVVSRGAIAGRFAATSLPPNPRLVNYASPCAFDFVVKTFTLKDSSRSLESATCLCVDRSHYVSCRDIQVGI